MTRSAHYVRRFSRLRRGAAREILSPSAHAWNAVSWASLALLVVAAARRITRSKPPARAASFFGFHGPQWGTAVTLQICPAIREGWPVSAVQIHHTPQPWRDIASVKCGK